MLFVYDGFARHHRCHARQHQAVRQCGEATLSPVVGLGLGTPQATDCALSNATNTTPGLKTQLSVATNISTYCVKIADIGNLTGAVDYTIRVVHP